MGQLLIILVYSFPFRSLLEDFLYNFFQLLPENSSTSNQYCLSDSFWLNQYRKLITIYAIYILNNLDSKIYLSAHIVSKTYTRGSKRNAKRTKLRVQEAF